MKTKEEVIKEAWGLVLPFEPKGGYNLNDGFSNKLYMEIDVNYSFFEYEQVTINMGIIRPKSLQGIENNNGWIRIESEEDLPKGYIECYFITKYSYNTILIGHFSFSDKIFYNNQNCYNINEITHYQPIIKPKNPLY